MSQTCSTEPVSFLLLERYLLDEVSHVEREQLQAHLGGCEVCRACFEALRSEPIELLPLPVPIRSVKPRVLWPLTLAASGLAMAAALLLFMRGTQNIDLARPGLGVHAKGGELAIELVREHAGNSAQEPTSFADGDRFEVRVTCPPEDAPRWDLVVFQGGKTFFPLQPVAPLRCANRVTLPGAFTLTGGQSTRVCVVLDTRGPVDRARLVQGLPAASACAVLNPVH
jgi:hypothetical protein